MMDTNEAAIERSAAACEISYNANGSTTQDEASIPTAIPLQKLSIICLSPVTPYNPNPPHPNQNTGRHETGAESGVELIVVDDYEELRPHSPPPQAWIGRVGVVLVVAPNR